MLAEMLLAARRAGREHLDDLLRAFALRRLPRVRAVDEGSMQILEWQLRHERGDVPALMDRTSRLLAGTP